ncbi:MAG TPA: hypothetical protein VFW98_12665 [Gemmatimonadaceae bacterium]|nr:hypothetical protein [Gemmatimonadaceae bacterium]
MRRFGDGAEAIIVERAAVSPASAMQVTCSWPMRSIARLLTIHPSPFRSSR